MEKDSIKSVNLKAHSYSYSIYFFATVIRRVQVLSISACIVFTYCCRSPLPVFLFYTDSINIYFNVWSKNRQGFLICVFVKFRRKHLSFASVHHCRAPKIFSMADEIFDLESLVDLEQKYVCIPLLYIPAQIPVVLDFVDSSTRATKRALNMDKSTDSLKGENLVHRKDSRSGRSWVFTKALLRYVKLLLRKKKAMRSKYFMTSSFYKILTILQISTSSSHCICTH